MSGSVTRTVTWEPGSGAPPTVSGGDTDRSAPGEDRARRTGRWPVSARLLAGLVLALAVLLTGCQSAEPTGDPMTSAIDAAELRTDRDPIAGRFPALGAFTDVHRVGGRLGDDRVPGPSTYFIEAVVTLAPADAERLASAYAFQPAPAGPPAPAALTPFLDGNGPWSTSPGLNAGAGPADWATEVFVRLDQGLAYVSARGE